MKEKCAVFILLGQSNAVGHGIPMKKEDIPEKPLKNVFGLNRKENQSFDKKELFFGGYTTHGTNLGETQDNTYSLANCLALLWQKSIDENAYLPDLYVIQIAIGSQGVTEKYMWYPEREKKLHSGTLLTADISLYPFSLHVFTLLDGYFKKNSKDYKIIGLHWRGGENDSLESKPYLKENLIPIYRKITDGFNKELNSPPIILHKILAKKGMYEIDNSGKAWKNTKYINSVFNKLSKIYRNVSVFDIEKADGFSKEVGKKNLFIEDGMHYTKTSNFFVAKKIIENFLKQRT